MPRAEYEGYKATLESLEYPPEDVAQTLSILGSMPTCTCGAAGSAAEHDEECLDVRADLMAEIIRTEEALGEMGEDVPIAPE